MTTKPSLETIMAMRAMRPAPAAGGPVPGNVQPGGGGDASAGRPLARALRPSGSLEVLGSLVQTSRPGGPGLASLPHLTRASALPTAAPPQPSPLRASLQARLALRAHKRDLGKAAGVKLGLSLSYSAINGDVYACAFSGALGGVTGGRVLSGLAEADYIDQVTIAAVWAQTFDTLWGSATGLNEVEAESMFLESYGAWYGRSPVALTAAQCTPTVTAIIASILEADAYLASLGVQIPLWRGGAPVVPATPVNSVGPGTVVVTEAMFGATLRGNLSAGGSLLYLLPNVGSLPDGFWFRTYINQNTGSAGTETVQVDGGHSEKMINPATGSPTATSWTSGQGGSSTAAGVEVTWEWDGGSASPDGGNLWLTY